MEKKMKIETKAIHAGDRKADPRRPGAFVPVTTPIYTAATYLYKSTAQLDRVLGKEEAGYCYSRYDNPTNAALEELMAALENGHGALVRQVLRGVGADIGQIFRAGKLVRS